VFYREHTALTGVLIEKLLPQEKVKTDMRVFVIGSGAREHSLVWKLGQDTRVSETFVTPGNPGMALDGAERISTKISPFTVPIAIG